MSEYQKGRERGYELGKLAAVETISDLSETIERLRAENEKLRAERDLWISRFEDFRKNAARLEEARSRPMRLVGSAAAAALKETNDDVR